MVSPQFGMTGLTYGRNTETDPLFLFVERSTRASFPKAAVMTLSDGGDFFGPGRAHVDGDQWQRRIADLCFRAECIVFTATPTPGAWWELNYLDQFGLFEKTIFIVPPLTWFSQRYGSEGPALAAFEATISQYRRMGINVPTVKKAGLLFAVDNRRTLLRSYPINSLAARKQMIQEFRRIAARDDNNGRPAGLSRVR